ncbi:hypothetical protein JOC34_000387 [Virgibacillus halotolerans]|nr:hypothetical protein [Virgibacillus halotolerans]
MANEYVIVLYDTKEFTEFVEYVKQTGGNVINSNITEYGRGIRVTYRLPTRMK